MSLWRLLRLELRRNAMPWMFPLLAALFVFDPFRTAMDYPPLWDLRASVVADNAAAGLRGVRGRGGGLDGVTGQPARIPPTWYGDRPAALDGLARHLGGHDLLGGLLYLCGVAVIYGVTATQATWGASAVVAGGRRLRRTGRGQRPGVRGRRPVPQPVHRAAGRLGAFFLSVEGFNNAVGQSTCTRCCRRPPRCPRQDVGVFYHYLPDVAIAQLMFLLGLTAVVLGGSGPGPGRRRRGCGCAAPLPCSASAGLAAAGTAIGLVGTAREGTAGEVIPALHDAANDRPIAFTPVCGQAGGVPVCVNPAYRPYLDQVSAAFRPVLGEVAGLPGAPARITQMGLPALSMPTGKFSGSPPVFYYSMPALGSAFGQTTARRGPELAAALRRGLHRRSPGVRRSGRARRPSRWSRSVLLQAIGSQWNQPGPGGGPRAEPAQAAAVTRFAALPAGARHAWLATHLAALRAGHITLAQLP